MKKTQVLATAIIGLTVVMMFLLFPSCRKEKKTEPVTATAPLTLFSRQSDPRLAQAVVDGGYLVDFLATKDKQATPVSLTAVSVHNADFSDESSILLNADGIQRICLTDGTQLIINSSTGSSFNVTLLTGDGSYQLNTNLTASAAEGKAINQVTNLGTAPRGGVPMSVTATPAAPKTNALVTNGSSGPNLAGVEIDVSKCGGIPADANAVFLNVYANYSGGPGKILPKIPAVHSATGLYFAAIPTGISTDYVVSSKDACLFALDAIQDIKEHKAAGVYTVLAKLLLDGSIAVTVNSPVIPQSVPKYLQKFADILNKAQSATDKFAAIKDNACDKVHMSSDDPFNYGGLKMQAEAQMQDDGGTKLSALAENIPSDGPYPTLKVALGDAPTVNQVTLNPASPAVNQSYLATAQLMCLLLGTTVQIGVQGTDGYTNTYQAVVSAADNTDPYTITLHVPGAATAGIRDVVTVSLKTAAGKTATKSAYLVFGQ
jgi:hypothetical protein